MGSEVGLHSKPRYTLTDVRAYHFYQASMTHALARHRTAPVRALRFIAPLLPVSRDRCAHLRVWRLPAHLPSLFVFGPVRHIEFSERALVLIQRPRQQLAQQLLVLEMLPLHEQALALAVLELRLECH